MFGSLKDGPLSTELINIFISVTLSPLNNSVNLNCHQICRQAPLCMVGAKINFPFLFLTHQEKRTRTDRAVDIPYLLYMLRIFSNRIFGVETT